MKIESTLLLASVCAATLLHPRLCDAQAVQPREALEDTRLYFTAPLRWDGRDWIEFGSTLVAVGIVHEFDDDVRDHFAGANDVARYEVGRCQRLGRIEVPGDDECWSANSAHQY